MVYTDAPTFGGAEQVLVTLLSATTARRVTVVGVTPNVVGRIASADPRIQVVLLPPVRTKLHIQAITAHVRAFRRLAPTVVHVNLRTPYAAQYGLFAALVAPRTKVIGVEHLPFASQSAVSRWLKRRTSGRLAAHVAVGERVARLVEQNAGLAAGSIRTIPNGVAANGASTVERLAAPPVIGAIGRLDYQKGFDVLVRALSLLPGVNCVIVGTGPAEAQLRSLAEQCGVANRLVLAGGRESADAALRGFDVLVVPSRFEGLPLVVLEAMSSGVPVVATDVGSVGEAVRNGETGLLVPPEDPERIAEALQRLLGDVDLRTELATRARASWAERFDASRMVRAYDRLYAELAA